MLKCRILKIRKFSTKKLHAQIELRFWNSLIQTNFSCFIRSFLLSNFLSFGLQTIELNNYLDTNNTILTNGKQNNSNKHSIETIIANLNQLLIIHPFLNKSIYIYNLIPSCSSVSNRRALRGSANTAGLDCGAIDVALPCREAKDNQDANHRLDSLLDASHHEYPTQCFVTSKGAQHANQSAGRLACYKKQNHSNLAAKQINSVQFQKWKNNSYKIAFLNLNYSKKDTSEIDLFAYSDRLPGSYNTYLMDIKKQLGVEMDAPVTTSQPQNAKHITQSVGEQNVKREASNQFRCEARLPTSERRYTQPANIQKLRSNLNSTNHQRINLKLNFELARGASQPTGEVREAHTSDPSVAKHHAVLRTQTTSKSKRIPVFPAQYFATDLKTFPRVMLRNRPPLGMGVPSSKGTSSNNLNSPCTGNDSQPAQQLKNELRSTVLIKLKKLPIVLYRWPPHVTPSIFSSGSLFLLRAPSLIDNFKLNRSSTSKIGYNFNLYGIVPSLAKHHAALRSNHPTSLRHSILFKNQFLKYGLSVKYNAGYLLRNITRRSAAKQLNVREAFKQDAKLVRSNSNLGASHQNSIYVQSSSPLRTKLKSNNFFKVNFLFPFNSVLLPSREARGLTNQDIKVGKWQTNFQIFENYNLYAGFRALEEKTFAFQKTKTPNCLISNSLSTLLHNKTQSSGSAIVAASKPNDGLKPDAGASHPTKQTQLLNVTYPSREAQGTHVGAQRNPGIAAQTYPAVVRPAHAPSSECETNDIGHYKKIHLTPINPSIRKINFFILDSKIIFDIFTNGSIQPEITFLFAQSHLKFLLKIYFKPIDSLKTLSIPY